MKVNIKSMPAKINKVLWCVVVRETDKVFSKSLTILWWLWYSLILAFDRGWKAGDEAHSTISVASWVIIILTNWNMISGLQLSSNWISFQFHGYCRWLCYTSIKRLIGKRIMLEKWAASHLCHLCQILRRIRTPHTENVCILLRNWA